MKTDVLVISVTLKAMKDLPPKIIKYNKETYFKLLSLGHFAIP